MKNLLPFLIIIFSTSNVFSQKFSTIIRFSYEDSMETRIPAPAFTPKDSAFMPSSPGLNTSIILKTEPDSVASNSNFSPLAKAQLFYPVDEYPVSAVVKVNYASGILVHERFVLTAVHVAGGPGKSSYSPAFDNGIEHPEFGTLHNKAHYKFDIAHDYEYDIVLVELEEPIGHKAGWIGIGYNKDQQFFFNRPFYSFGYPAIDHVPGSNRFNSDTMFHFFGEIDDYDHSYLRVYSSHYSGQSGSGIFSYHSGNYINYGILSASTRFKYLTDSAYAGFKFIIDSVNSKYATITGRESDLPLQLQVYPNPVTNQLVVSLPGYTNTQKFSYTVSDMQGRKFIFRTEEKFTGQTAIDVSGLSEGMYVIKVHIGAQVFMSKFLKANK